MITITENIDQQVQVKSERLFRDFVRREALVATEKGCLQGWNLYQHLKGFIHCYDVEYEAAIKIIVEEVGL